MNKFYKSFFVLVLISFLSFGLITSIDVKLVSAESEITNVEAAQLIEILISAGAIAPDKVAKAREMATSLRGGASAATLTQDLTVGSSGSEVLALQKILNRDTDTRVANTGNGSPNNETTYFGEATKAAVVKFQQKYGISPASGYVGPATRQKMNEISSGQQPSTNNGLTLNTAGTVPFVDIRVGTLDASYVNVGSNTPFTLVWVSKNVTSCSVGSNSKPTVGTQTISGITEQTVFGITCTGPQGSATDYVTAYTNTANPDNQIVDNNQNDYTYTQSTTTYYTYTATNTNPNTYNNPTVAACSIAPCVDLKVDGKDTGINTSVKSDKYQYTLSWTGKGVKNCKLQATSTDSQFNVKEYNSTSTSDIVYQLSQYTNFLSTSTTEVYKMSFPGFVYGESASMSGTKVVKLPTAKNLTFSISCEADTNASRLVSDSVYTKFSKELLPMVDLKLDNMDRLTQAYNQKYFLPAQIRAAGGGRPYNAVWTSRGVTSCVGDNKIQFYAMPQEKIISGWSSTTKQVYGNERIVLNGDPDISKITVRITCNDGYVSDRNSTTTGVYKGLIDFVASPYARWEAGKVCNLDGLSTPGEDLIAADKITWPSYGADVGTWPITASLGVVSVSGGVVSYPHDKVNVWPAVPVAGVGQDAAAGVYGNAWIITPTGPRNAGGTYDSYVANTSGWLNPGQTTKSTDELQGPGKMADLSCGAVGSMCAETGLPVPAYYGFMVSTIARGGYRSPSNERSNIVVSACKDAELEAYLNGQAQAGNMSQLSGGTIGGTSGQSAGGLDAFKSMAGGFDWKTAGLGGILGPAGFVTGGMFGGSLGSFGF